MCNELRRFSSSTNARSSCGQGTVDTRYGQCKRRFEHECCAVGTRSPVMYQSDLTKEAVLGHQLLHGLPEI